MASRKALLTAPSRRARSSESNGRAVLVVSNRLPFTVYQGPAGSEIRRSAGGLISALEPVLQSHRGAWIGWAGGALKKGEEALWRQAVSYPVEPVALSSEDVDRYYHGFSNGTLWPLFHSLVERTQFDPAEWASYERVNVRFAQAAAARCRASDLVWVQDYHLMRMPQHLRRMMRRAQIAFFLHTPFPPYDIFRVLPWAREILRGLLACDLVGFHVAGYMHNFLDCAERILGSRVDRRRFVVEEGDRTVNAHAFPLGIDFDRFEDLARKAPEAKTPRERIILGVDRLDYTKGIPERIEAFEHLLQTVPGYREKVTLVQIAVPSRAEVPEYRALKRTVDELVGRVNGRFGTADWTPIRYLYQELSADRLAGLYRDADVALVTPLRDGMNLVAKEFVACQVGKPGVLIVSQLAGTAETMHEAIRVNPYNVEATAAALDRALSMDEAERLSRLAALRRRERRDNVHAWVEKFLAATRSAPAGLRPPDAEDFQGWLGVFLRGYRLALFIDYDGTLAPFQDDPSEARPSSRAQDAIDECARRPDSDVTVVSGRALSDIEALVGNAAMTVAGNGGLEIKGPGLPEFRHPDLVHYESRTRALGSALGALEEDGAWTEQKGPALAFHFRRVPRRRRKELVARARDLITSMGFGASETSDSIEAVPPIGFDRGLAALHVLRSRYGPSWSEGTRVVYVGNDEADEDAFRLFSGLAITFKVGSADTQTLASHRLRNVEAVEALLVWLAGREGETARPEGRRGGDGSVSRGRVD